MAQSNKICNARIVQPDRTVHGHLYIEDGIITHIEPAQPSSANAHDTRVDKDSDVAWDARGMYIFPGLIDIHSDAIEKEVQPRPNTLFPMDMAMVEMEKKLAVCGITTMYHSLSLGVGLSLRGNELMLQLLEQIIRHREQRSIIRHRIHLRYEITHLPGMDIARELIRQGKIDYLSYMNHSPGQGQYKEPGSFQNYVMKNQGVDQEEVQRIVDNVLELQAKIDWNGLATLASMAGKKGIRIASHDDDSTAKIDEMAGYGATVSEFPLNLATARYASERNLYVCVGAPNVIRGGSHDKNMRAIDAIKAGYADILCSDYQPSSLLWSVFKLAEEGIPLHRAVNMASLNPATALGLAQRTGSIEAGKQADLLWIEMADGYPHVRRVMVEGTEVYTSNAFSTMNPL